MPAFSFCYVHLHEDMLILIYPIIINSFVDIAMNQKKRDIDWMKNELISYHTLEIMMMKF